MRKLLLSISLIALMMSCSTQLIKTTAPFYTNIERVAQLHNGMSLEQIIANLGIEPFDVYHIQEDGSTVVIFNYRTKERIYKHRAKDKEARSNEASQTVGNVYYQTPGKLYLLLTNNKLVSLVSDNGRAQSSYLLVKKNTIQFINKEQINTITNTYTPHIVKIK